MTQAQPQLQQSTVNEDFSPHIQTQAVKENMFFFLKKSKYQRINHPVMIIVSLLYQSIHQIYGGCSFSITMSWSLFSL